MSVKEVKTDDGWVYIYDNAKTDEFNYEITDIRYVLGGKSHPEREKNVLICIGINPSTAIPKVLDPTLTRVKKYADENGYSEWYMLNVYPLRSINPKNLHQKANYGIHSHNIQEISKLFNKFPVADIWCAWGAGITDPDNIYLQDLLYGNDDIKGILQLFGKGHTLKAYDLTDKEQHPKHPLVMTKSSHLKDLNSFPNLNDKLRQAINNLKTVKE